MIDFLITTSGVVLEYEPSLFRYMLLWWGFGGWAYIMAVVVYMERRKLR